MCGRFVSARKRAELLEEFSIERDRVTEEPRPDYNVAPTKKIYGVVTRHSGHRGDGDGAGERQDAADGDHAARQLRLLRWGLVPSWAKDPSGGARLINARAETVAVKPSFRKAFARRRCLIPADGYYEWQPVEEQGHKIKQPYYMSRVDGGVLAFAGIYELWRDDSLPDDHENAWLWTAAIITTQAADDLGHIHDRMPMVIAADRWTDWLDPDRTDTDLVQEALQPAASSGLASRPVSTEVNSVRNNGAELIKPMTLSSSTLF